MAFSGHILSRKDIKITKVSDTVHAVYNTYWGL